MSTEPKLVQPDFVGMTAKGMRHMTYAVGASFCTAVASDYVHGNAGLWLWASSWGFGMAAFFGGLVAISHALVPPFHISHLEDDRIRPRKVVS